MEPKTTEQLEKEIADLKAENETLHAVNKDLTLEIEALKTEPEAPLAPGLVNKLSFEFDGATYGFKIAGINHDGKVITAEQVVANKKLQAQLIAMKSGMITVVA